MADDTKPNPRKIKTVPFRMSFPHILKARAAEEGGKPRFELTMLLPPGTDLAPFKTALRAAMTEKHGDDPKKWPRLKRKPDDVIRDFAKYNAEEAKTSLPGDWTGWTMIRTAAPEDRPPGVVGSTKGGDGKFPIITDSREVYGGRWARATVEAYFYSRKDGSGVTFALVNVQLLKHDVSFGNGVTKPEDDFDNADAAWAGEDGAKESKTDDDGWN